MICQESHSCLTENHLDQEVPRSRLAILLKHFADVGDAYAERLRNHGAARPCPMRHPTGCSCESVARHAIADSVPINRGQHSNDRGQFLSIDSFKGSFGSV